MPVRRSKTTKSKTRKKTRKTTRRKRQRGGKLKENDRNMVRENDRNRFKENYVPAGYVTDQRNILASIPKSIPAIPVAMNHPAAYPVTGKVPLLDRLRGFLKQGRYISKAARSLGAHGVADTISQYGYGTRRRKRRARKTRK